MTELSRIRETYSKALQEVAEALELVNDVASTITAEMENHRLRAVGDDDELDTFIKVARRNMETMAHHSREMLEHHGIAVDLRPNNPEPRDRTLPEMIQQMQDALLDSQTLIREITELSAQLDQQGPNWWKLW